MNVQSFIAASNSGAIAPIRTPLVGRKRLVTIYLGLAYAGITLTLGVVQSLEGSSPAATTALGTALERAGLDTAATLCKVLSGAFEVWLLCASFAAIRQPQRAASLMRPGLVGIAGTGVMWTVVVALAAIGGNGWARLRASEHAALIGGVLGGLVGALGPSVVLLRLLRVVQAEPAPARTLEPEGDTHRERGLVEGRSPTHGRLARRHLVIAFALVAFGGLLLWGATHGADSSTTSVVSPHGPGGQGGRRGAVVARDALGRKIESREECDSYIVGSITLCQVKCSDTYRDTPSEFDRRHLIEACESACNSVAMNLPDCSAAFDRRGEAAAAPPTMDLPSIDLPTDAGEEASKGTETGGTSGSKSDAAYANPCSATCSGAITDDIRNVVSARVNAARQCTRTAIVDGEGLAGEMGFSLVIGANGQTCSIKITSDTTESLKLQQCVRQRLGVTYPVPTGGCASTGGTVSFGNHGGRSATAIPSPSPPPVAATPAASAKPKTDLYTE